MPAPHLDAEARHALIHLPKPAAGGTRTLEEVLHLRRSTREFSSRAVELRELSQLAWAVLGHGPDGHMTIPSAGAIYPLRLYVVAGHVSGLEPGIYRYHAESHALVQTDSSDCRPALCAAALGQTYIRSAAVDLVMIADFQQVMGKYGERGLRYVYMEAGHAAQNVYLQAAALGLGTVAIGAFDDAEVTRMLRLARVEHPLYIMPVGRIH